MLEYASLFESIGQYILMNPQIWAFRNYRKKFDGDGDRFWEDQSPTVRYEENEYKLPVQVFNLNKDEVVPGLLLEIYIKLCLLEKIPIFWWVKSKTLLYSFNHCISNFWSW